MTEVTPKNEEPSNNEKFGNSILKDSNRIVSISAIVISLFTLFILIYQSQLLNRQFELAQKQQYASVLPYLEIGPSYTGDSYSIRLLNAGVGPAFIKDVYVVVEGETYQMDLFGFVNRFSTEEDSLGQIKYSSIFSGRVLQPGQHFELLGSDQSARAARKLREFIFKHSSMVFVIEYASIYDERWFLDTSLTPMAPVPQNEYVREKAE